MPDQLPDNPITEPCEGASHHSDEPSHSEPSHQPSNDTNDILLLLRQLLAGFEEKLKYDSTRDRMIDRLHSELQEYKADILYQAIRPLLIDLVELYDHLAEWDGSTPLRDHQVTFADVQRDLEDILARSGIEVLVIPEDVFDPRQQRVLRTVPTDDPNLDRRVAERLRKGFRYGTRVVRPECVSVYVLGNPTLK